MRRAVHFLALGFVSFGLTGCGDVVLDGWNQFHEDFHYAYPLAANGRVEVENRNGPIEISGWDQNKIDISGTRYASSPDLLKEIRIEVTPATDSISVRTVRPDFSWGNQAVRYVIHVPHGVELARVVSSNGPIHVDDVDAGVSLRTSNGPVRVDDSKGGIDVTTSNGPVNIRGAAGPVMLRTSNGPIELTLDSVAEVRAKTSNGPITLRIPSGAGAILHARTTRGRIRSDFELSAERRISSNDLEGTIGRGGPLLDLSTSNGPIRILQW
jgi:DUF4097 and DUF4098 domain-containing protein YvlB